MEFKIITIKPSPPYNHGERPSVTMIWAILILIFQVLIFEIQKIRTFNSHSEYIPSDYFRSARENLNLKLSL